MELLELKKTRSICALVTCFESPCNLKVDFEKTEEIAKAVSGNVDGFVIAGKTGEGDELNQAKRIHLFKKIKKENPDKVLIYGLLPKTIDRASSELKALSKARLKIDALLLAIPEEGKNRWLYNKGEIYKYYRFLLPIDFKIPVILYNNLKDFIPSEIIIKLANEGFIVGLKESTGDMGLLEKIRENTSKDFLIYTGVDRLLLNALNRGANGIIGCASHIVGKEIKSIIENYQKERRKAQISFAQIYPLLFALEHPYPACTIKFALNYLRWDVGGLYKNTPKLEIEKETKIIEALKDLIQLELIQPLK